MDTIKEKRVLKRVSSIPFCFQICSKIFFIQRSSSWHDGIKNYSIFQLLILMEKAGEEGEEG